MYIYTIKRKRLTDIIRQASLLLVVKITLIQRNKQCAMALLSPRL